MPIAIVNRRMRRPALSTTRQARAVPTNWMRPTEMDTSLLFVKPATAKMPAALKRTALTPLNCWKIINPMLIIRGLYITGDNQSFSVGLSLRSAKK